MNDSFCLTFGFLFALVLASNVSGQEMVGRYGFVTSRTFDCQEASAARERIRVMVEDYGIREFQFHDWFFDYSTPIRTARWTDPFFRKAPICLSTLEAYIDEIHAHGARAWAYVQAVGAEETSWANPGAGIFPMLDKHGQWHWHVGRFPCYFLNGFWAKHMVSAWAPVIRAMRFDGIHWDALGPFAAVYEAEKAGVKEFIQVAYGLLEPYGLKQTFNFVDLFWWDDETVANSLEFPYAEVWSRKQADTYFSFMAHSIFKDRTGAIAYYPTVDKPSGVTEEEVLIARHQESLSHRLFYIAIGDGERRLINEYWPNTRPLTLEAAKALKIR